MAKAPAPTAPRQSDDEGSFEPYVSPATKMAEFTWSALLMGAMLGIVFGASSLYLVLKVGMTVSASIPVAVLSITLFRALSRAFGFRRATILENNIVQTTGSAGESIAFGVGVTMPALMILGYEMDITRVMVVSVLGGVLGILMMIPLRRAFIVKQHGKLKYPEGTACADVLIVGEVGGSTAKTVFVGFGFAILYKLLANALRLWKDTPERMLSFFKGASISGELTPELLGVGYIIGTRIACVMVAGGIMSYWLLIPAIKLFGDGLNTPVFPSESMLIRDMDPGKVRDFYVLYIGAGAVAAGGIISLIQALPLILGSFRSGLRDLLKKGDGDDARKLRTEQDLPLWFVALGSLALVIAIAGAPPLGLGFGLRGLVGGVLIVLFGFLFVTVSSRLTGEIGSSSNPISGMTVATLLLTCLVFVLMGTVDPNGEWVGREARLPCLSIAAVVCIACSNGGTTSQDLKTGYLVGATPKWQQWAIVVGAITSAMVIGAILLLLNNAGTVYAQRSYPGLIAPIAKLTEKEPLHGPEAVQDKNLYFVWRVGQDDAFWMDKGTKRPLPPGKYLVNDQGEVKYLVDPGINGVEKKRIVDGKEETVTKYDAPKARLMSLIIDGILTGKLPWNLVLLGVAITIVLELCGIPSLAFAVGVYLPLSSSTPIFIGGMARWVVDKVTKKSAEESEMSAGVLFSSGYIAGGAIAGILIALVSLAPTISKALDFSGTAPAVTESDWTSLIAFGILTLFLLLVGTGKLLSSDEKPPKKD